MAKDKQEIDSKSAGALDTVAKKILSIVDSGYSERNLLDNRNNKFRSIMDRELELSKGISGGSIIDFVATMMTNNTQNKPVTTNKVPTDSTALFTKDISDIFGYFQDLYKNRFIEMSDLKFIAKFIPALGEAVKTTLDAIVSSDDVSATINRSIQLPSGVSAEDKGVIMAEIERCEQELGLLNKFKNVVYKKSLVTGQYYVYAIAYSKLFAEYDAVKQRKEASSTQNMGMSFGRAKRVANESTGTIAAENSNMLLYGDIDMSPAFESMKTMLKTEKLTTAEISTVENNLKDSLPNITIDDTSVLFEALEGAGAVNINKMMNSYQKKENINLDNLAAQDGTKGTNEIKSADESKYDVSGTYLKYIDSKNVIPAKILDMVAGYYVIHPTLKKNKTKANSGTLSMSTSLFNTVNVAEKKKEEAIGNIVDTISDGIINSFSSKFVADNSTYKKLIADCIIANGISDNDFNIQFIPAEHMFEFKVNENEDGYGESILIDSLFPAKTLLTMIVTRMLNYVNKTGNKTIAHIYKGPIDAYATNQINRVVQDLQESTITFNDMLSPNSLFNKFNRDANIALPTSRDGKKLVEFETQEGQNIDMSPEYENKLEQMAILGSGVPSVIMEYAGSADFAKQIVSANIKFAGRVSTLQGDLETPSTNLYRYILQNTALTPELKSVCANGLYYKLPKPKVLVNGNNSDFIRTTIECAQQIGDSYIPQDSELPNAKDLRADLVLAIVKDNAPFFNWSRVDAIFEDIKVKHKVPPKKDDTSL